MDGSSGTRASSSSSSTPAPAQAQQARAPQRAGTSEAPRANVPVVGKPFAGILAASFGHRGATPLGAGLRARPGATGASLANAARRAAGGGAAGGLATGPGATAGAKGKALDDDGTADADAGGARTQVHHVKEDDKSRDARDLDLLDPATRQAAMLAPPLIQTATPATSSAASPLRARTMEELLPALVKRIAWAGDKNRGTVHLELGAGAFAGTKITVHADAGKVRVELSGQEGPELDRLRARLDERLRGHGLDVESVT